EICHFEKVCGQYLSIVKPSIDGYFSYISVPSSLCNYLEIKSEFLIRQIANNISQEMLNIILNEKLEKSLSCKDISASCCQNSTYSQFE
ncbi:MAG: hypothetical protein MHPSP_002721, partial [Paramarteilia canceri]